ncbi:MAG TPA: hypothetical protein VHX86_00035 [Tepidisphaeraceae bacterium]|nr:hypothetical protein [Tepidisphaeraceae bacterium]
MESKAVAAELGRRTSQDVCLQIVGIGAKRLKLEMPGEFTGVILAGLAGALDPTLKVGDIVIDRNPAPNSPSPSTLGEDLGIRYGKIFTSEHLAATVAEKRRLFQETGCLAVDMEGAIVRAAAESAGLPMLNIRAISDPADQALPERMMRWVDEVGQPRPTAVAAELAIHPFQIPALIRLGRQSRLAARKMAQAVRQVVQSEAAF